MKYSSKNMICGVFSRINPPSSLLFITIFTVYIFLVLFFTINHSYLSWDEIMFKVVGRTFFNEPGSELFKGMGIYKAPLFSFLLGLFGSYDFLVVAVPAIINFLLFSAILFCALNVRCFNSNYYFLGLLTFSLSYQLQYYFIVFYSETMSILFVLCSIIAFIKNKHPLILALLCFGAFTTKIYLAILFPFYLLCYLFINKKRKSIIPFICLSILLLLCYGLIEFYITGKIAAAFLSMLHKVENANPWIIKDKGLSLGFYGLASFDILGIPNGILFYIGSILFTWRIFTKKETPEIIKVSYLLILCVMSSLTIISTKSDRFLIPILPIIIATNMWTLSEIGYALATLRSRGNSIFNAISTTTFYIVATILLFSAMGAFSLFQYIPLLSRGGYSFSEPRTLQSPKKCFQWRTKSEKNNLINQGDIFYKLHSSHKNKAIYTDLWLQYVYANFGHKVISVKTAEMERKKSHIRRIDVKEVPKGGLFLGKHHFENAQLIGQAGSIKGFIIK